MAHQVRMRKFEPIPNGLYPAVFKSFEETKTRYGMSYFFYFEITAQVGNIAPGQSVRGLVSPQLTPKSKLARWIRAMGIEMQENDTLDLDTLIGRQVVVEVEQVISKDQVYSNVKDVKSVQAMAAFQPQPQPVQQPAQQVPVQQALVQQPTQQPSPAQQPATAPNINVGEDEILF
jgi:hypothetical protein